MKKIMIRYDAKSRSACLELVAKGYTYREVAKLIGIGTATLSRWRLRDDKFNEAMIETRSKAIREVIDVGLFKLASGIRKEEITEEWLENREDTKGEERVVKIKRKVIELPPDSKAIEILSRQHAKEYTDKGDEAKSVTNILNYNTSGYSLRELQEDLKNSPIEVSDINDLEYVETTGANVEADSDYSDLEVGVPPSSGE